MILGSIVFQENKLPSQLIEERKSLLFDFNSSVKTFFLYALFAQAHHSQIHDYKILGTLALIFS